MSFPSDAALFEGVCGLQDGGLAYGTMPSYEGGDLGEKRGRSDDPDPGGKRSRMDVVGDGDAHVLKLLVPNHMVGSIIGKQGVVLRSIMDP